MAILCLQQRILRIVSLIDFLGCVMKDNKTYEYDYSICY